jgi:hypothetical protein
MLEAQVATALKTRRLNSVTMTRVSSGRKSDAICDLLSLHAQPATLSASDDQLKSYSTDRRTVDLLQPWRDRLRLVSPDIGGAVNRYHCRDCRWK